jgi:hypothetical protein
VCVCVCVSVNGRVGFLGSILSTPARVRLNTISPHSSLRHRIVIHAVLLCQTHKWRVYSSSFVAKLYNPTERRELHPEPSLSSFHQ